MNEEAANERGFPSKTSLSGEERLDDAHASAATHGYSPIKGWASVTRNGGRFGGNERCVTDEEVAQLQQVFNETLVIPEERLAKNREQWKFFANWEVPGQ